MTGGRLPGRLLVAGAITGFVGAAPLQLVSLFYVGSPFAVILVSFGLALCGVELSRRGRERRRLAAVGMGLAVLGGATSASFLWSSLLFQWVIGIVFGSIMLCGMLIGFAGGAIGWVRVEPWRRDA